MHKDLGLALASTIRHDGHGGVADDLAEIDGLTSWVHDHADLLDRATPTAGASLHGRWAAGFTADEAAWSEVVALRQAVRALFAYAVRPGPPSPADAHRLLPLDQALDRLNAAAARAPVTPRLDWPSGGEPLVDNPSTVTDAAARLVAAVARDTMNLLSGPRRPDLRACTAPRCVRYFLKEHGRQEFCKTSCANRARAARHYERHRANPAEPVG
ncbi:ABATE domain-containing protein [Plantactinospora sp. B5E13]|uniref:CGNR zinc finger domain-containing protein n=1 Tax=Plantactinospora sp. B5E13 TaxID=3153758 RepID=UPI00325C383E